MTEEERRRALNAKFGDPVVEMETAMGAAMPDDSEDRLAELNAKFGDPSAALAEATPQPPQEEPGFLQQAKHVAKGVGRGMLDTIDMGYNLEHLADQGLKWAGVEGGLPGEISTTKPSDALPQSWQETIAGREFDREGNEFTDSARIAAEWAGPGLVPKLLRKAGGKLPEVLAGAGAAGGAFVDDYLGDDSVLGQMIGGLLGGAAGGLRRSGSQIDAEAATIVENVIDLDPGSRKVLQTSLEAGDVGTLGDLAADAGLDAAQTTRLLDLEGGLKSAYQDSRIAFDAKEAARAQQVADRTADVFGADVNTAGGLEAAKAQLASRRANIEQGASSARGNIIDTNRSAVDKLDEGVQAAERQLSEANAALGVADETLAAANKAIETPLSPAQAGQGVAKTFDRAEGAFKMRQEQPAWDAHDQAGIIDVTDVNATVKQYLKSLNEVDRKNLLKKYGPEINTHKLWETPTPDKLDSFTGGLSGAEAPPPKRTPAAEPKEVSTFISDMKSAAAETRASATGGGRTEKLLDDLYNAVDETYTELNPLYAQAQAKTAEKYKRFYPGKVGKARRGDAETLVRDLSLADEPGAVTARLLEDAQVPSLQPRVVESLRAAAQREGGVTDTFMMKYRDVMDTLPAQAREEFQQALEATGGRESALKQTTAAQRAADSTQAQAATAGPRLEAAKEAALSKAATRAQGLKNTVDKNVVSKYATSPTKTIKDLATGDDSAGKLKRLYDFQVKQGQGDSFKAAVYESLADNDMNKGTELGKSVRKNLVESGILTAEEADSVTAALARNQSSALRKSSIASKLDAMGGTGNETDNLLASLGSAVIVAGLPGSGSSLLVGGAVRRKLRQMLRQRGHKPAELKRIEEFLLDPEEFLGPGLKAKDANEAVDMIMTKIVGRAQATALAAEEED